MKPTLRWKKNPRPTGLARICSGHPGHALLYVKIKCAQVAEHSPLHTGKSGWYWYARMDELKVPLYNSCNDEPLTEDGAKDAAMNYVRKSLANAKVSHNANNQKS